MPRAADWRSPSRPITRRVEAGHLSRQTKSGLRLRSPRAASAPCADLCRICLSRPFIPTIGNFSTAFDSDAALIIRDPDVFAQRLISAFLARWPDWEAEWRPVTYYAPYRDYTKVRVHEMSKHFGYAYQREVRIVLRAKRRPRANLEPEFLDIGPMTDYAEMDLTQALTQKDSGRARNAQAIDG
jgi:hypothetical protein